jgi:hypothetical protein
LASRLHKLAVFNTGVARRTAPIQAVIRDAAASEPVAAELLAWIDRERLESMALHAREAKRSGQLAVSVAECRDVLWSTTDGALWQRLVAGRGWSNRRYSTFLGNLWVSALVDGAQEP